MLHVGKFNAYACKYYPTLAAMRLMRDSETAAVVSGGSSRLAAIISNICVRSSSDPDTRGWMRDTRATMNDVHAWLVDARIFWPTLIKKIYRKSKWIDFCERENIDTFDTFMVEK